MQTNWDNNSPIYKQVKARIAALLLDGRALEGEALPSVRQISTDLQVNPLTVSRAYQELVDEGLVEVRRGMGMFVTNGAVERLLDAERKLFLEQEWPSILQRAKKLGLDVKELMKLTSKGK